MAPALHGMGARVEDPGSVRTDARRARSPEESTIYRFKLAALVFVALAIGAAPAGAKRFWGSRAAKCDDLP